jgi:cytochrome c oxidase assembly protein subunit 15
MPNGFKWLSFGSMSLVYATMILGVYLSSIHQSLSCSEWPLCPNGFFKPPEHNYLVEYFHRLFVVFTTCTIYATSVFAYVRIKRMQHLTLLAAIVVSIQILIGALVVTSRLDIRFVSIHLPIGVTLFGITLLTFLMYMKRLPTGADNSTLDNSKHAISGPN